MTRRSFENSDLNLDRLKRMLIKGWGQPEVLVAPFYYLKGAVYISSIDLHVDGGWMANGL